MTEKRYLKWYNKVGYGSGDIAGNVVYAFLSTFMMFYLTDTVGMNMGMVIPRVGIATSDNSPWSKVSRTTTVGDNLN